MRITRTRIVQIAIVVLVVSYPVVSEIVYHRSISPGSATHFMEFEEKVSPESSVHIFAAEKGELLQFEGLLPRRGLLALPSAAPSYYFNRSGVFIGWVRDPGDMEVPAQFRSIGEVKTVTFEEAKGMLSGDE